MLRNNRILLFAGTAAAILSLPVFAFPQTSSVQSVAGIVLEDSAPVNDARVSLSQSGTSRTDEAVTNTIGGFSLSTAKTGECLLRVHKDGYRELELQVKLPLATATPLRISLVRETSSASHPTRSHEEMPFSDQPHFTVAGITDWTAAGGHGSDVNLRASEALARETRGLTSSSVPSPMYSSEQERNLRAAVLKEPASFQANRALGQYCLRERQFADAIASLERAHQLKPEDFGTSYELAQAYQGAERYGEAKALVKQLLANNESADLHHSMAEIEEALNNPLAAEHEYERAVRLQPSEENYFAWGSELLVHRAVEAAVEVFTMGAKAFPHSERMLAGLGATLYAHGSYEAGAERLCAASDLNPSDPQPYLFLGTMEQAAPRPLPCVQEKLERFARQRPNDAWANYYYAVALAKSEDEPSQAKQIEALLENAVRLDSKFAQAHLQLGVLQARRGDWQHAKQSYEKAATSDPNLPDPHFRLAQVYKQTGEQQRASQELQAFDSLKRSDAAAVEQRRREIRQFIVVMKDANTQPAN